MAPKTSSPTTTRPENTSQYPTNAVVVATAEGLERFPERIRGRLVNRWGVVHGVRSGAPEVMVHYPPTESKHVEMLVPYSLEGTSLSLVPDDDALVAWRQSVDDYRAMKNRVFRVSRNR